MLFLKCKLEVKHSFRNVTILGNLTILHELETNIQKINHYCEKVIFINNNAFNPAKQEFYIILDIGHSQIMVNFGFF